MKKCVTYFPNFRQRARNFRYLVHEPSEHLENIDNVGIHLGGFRPQNPGPVGIHLGGFRPQNPDPYGPNGRPIVPSYPDNGVLVGPGGPTGIIGR